ncbi:DUF4190 domain-containing protein [Streptomyces sp. NPDC000345]|uniref:DUF4190 domain-containing protein n=1 Tax=Streptomyces sp. NPDC000345 TaxID=3364537 RepID=UPI003698C348
MSDDAPTPAGDAGRETWPAPAADEAAGPRDAAPEARSVEGPRDAPANPANRVRLDKAPADEPPMAEAPTAADPAPDPSATAGDGTQDGPGRTLAEIAPPAPRDQAPPSAHDRLTVTSLPGATPQPPADAGPQQAPAGGGPQPWASPVAPPVNGSFASFPPPDPATASGGPPPHPFTPGTVPSPPHPFTPPFAPPPPSPFAPPAAPTGAVPPPPISPDGPGQVPYGYPGGYGYGYPAPPPGGSYWPGGPQGESNGMGVAGMVLGIVSAVIFCLWPLAIGIGILGIVFGAIGRRKARRGEATNPGQALAGIICGIAGIVLGVGLGVLVILAPA